MTRLRVEVGPGVILCRTDCGMREFETSANLELAGGNI